MGDDTIASGKVAAEPKRRGGVATFFIRLVKEKPMGTVGAIIVLGLLVCGVLADYIAPYGPNEMNLRAVLVPPSADYLLGTDQLGRDMLSRIIHGARISMIVGLGASAIDAFLATLIGIISGYFGGKVDLVLQRFVDATIVFPPLFFYLAIMAIIGPGLFQVTFCLGVLRGIGSVSYTHLTLPTKA